MAMAQVANLQIKVLEGEGGVHPAGAHVTRPLTVEVTDESGRPVAGAAVSFQLPPTGPGGLFLNGLRTDLVLTDANGRATLHGVQLNRTEGGFRIRITAVKEQARAGAVSMQYIGGDKNGAPATLAPAAPAPAASAPAPPAAPAPAVTATVRPAQPAPAVTATSRSGEITPTTAKMSSGSHKKWLVVAAVVVAGGVAFLGVSRASSKSSSSSSTVPSSTVSIGTPTITIGQP